MFLFLDNDIDRLELSVRWWFILLRLELPFDRQILLVFLLAEEAFGGCGRLVVQIERQVLAVELVERARIEVAVCITRPGSHGNDAIHGGIVAKLSSCSFFAIFVVVINGGSGGHEWTFQIRSVVPGLI